MEHPNSGTKISTIKNYGLDLEEPHIDILKEIKENLTDSRQHCHCIVHTKIVDFIKETLTNCQGIVQLLRQQDASEIQQLLDEPCTCSPEQKDRVIRELLDFIENNKINAKKVAQIDSQDELTRELLTTSQEFEESMKDVLEHIVNIIFLGFVGSGRDMSPIASDCKLEAEIDDTVRTVMDDVLKHVLSCSGSIEEAVLSSVEGILKSISSSEILLHVSSCENQINKSESNLSTVTNNDQNVNKHDHDSKTTRSMGSIDSPETLSMVASTFDINQSSYAEEIVPVVSSTETVDNPGSSSNGGDESIGVGDNQNLKPHGILCECIPCEAGAAVPYVQSGTILPGNDNANLLRNENVMYHYQSDNQTVPVESRELFWAVSNNYVCPKDSEVLGDDEGRDFKSVSSSFEMKSMQSLQNTNKENNPGRSRELFWASSNNYVCPRNSEAVGDDGERDFKFVNSENQSQAFCDAISENLMIIRQLSEDVQTDITLGERLLSESLNCSQTSNEVTREEPSNTETDLYIKNFISDSVNDLFLPNSSEEQNTDDNNEEFSDDDNDASSTPAYSSPVTRLKRCPEDFKIETHQQSIQQTFPEADLQTSDGSNEIISIKPITECAYQSRVFLLDDFQSEWSQGGATRPELLALMNFPLNFSRSPSPQRVQSGVLYNLLSGDKEISEDGTVLDKPCKSTPVISSGTKVSDNSEEHLMERRVQVVDHIIDDSENNFTLKDVSRSIPEFAELQENPPQSLNKFHKNNKRKLNLVYELCESEIKPLHEKLDQLTSKIRSLDLTEILQREASEEVQNYETGDKPPRTSLLTSPRKKICSSFCSASASNISYQSCQEYYYNPGRFSLRSLYPCYYDFYSQYYYRPKPLVGQNLTQSMIFPQYENSIQNNQNIQPLLKYDCKYCSSDGRNFTGNRQSFNINKTERNSITAVRNNRRDKIKNVKISRTVNENNKRYNAAEPDVRRKNIKISRLHD